MVVPNSKVFELGASCYGDLRRCSTKKHKTYTKKGTHGPTAGHGVTMLPCCRLWVLLCHKRSGTASVEKRVNAALIWFGWLKIIDFQCFFWPLKSKVESPGRRNANFHSWVTRLPIEMNAHFANIFWRLLQIPAFCLLPWKIRISNSSPLQGRRVNRLPSLYIEKSLHNEVLTQRSLHTQRLLHREAFYTKQLFHWGAFTQRNFPTEKLVHSEALTQRSLSHREAFTHRSFYTNNTLTQRSFYRQTLVRKETFTNRNFHKQKLVHTKDVLHRGFYTQKLLHKRPWHREIFTHRSFYIQKLLRKETFTRRNF